MVTVPDSRNSGRQACRRRAVPGDLPDDLYAYIEDDGDRPPPPPPPRIGRPRKHHPETWTVTDDWPEKVPVTEAEIDLIEAWFGDILDELFGPVGTGKGLRKSSDNDNNTR
jgi:hypothetical protein